MPTFYNFVDPKRQNLVSYSTYNASTWSSTFPSFGTITTGITAPDGTNTAIRFTANNGGNSQLRVTFPAFTASGSDRYVLSFYARYQSGFAFDLRADVGDVLSNEYSTIYSTPNVWRRVVIGQANLTAGTYSFLDLMSSNTSNWVIDYWGVQLELRSSGQAGPYLATNGTPLTAGDDLTYSFDDVFVPADAFRQGNLWTWGRNYRGLLGDNTTVPRSTPVTTFAGGTNWKQVGNLGAIKTDGTLWVWGDNYGGRLGINVLGTGGSNRPTPVTTFAGGTNWKQVTTSNNNTAAIKTDGTLWVWGLGSFGILGNNATSPRSTPVTTFAGGTNWKQVYINNNPIAAIKTDGTLWVWGSYAGDNTTSQRNTPVTTFAGGTNWKQVSCGGSYVAAIKTDGTLWTWGVNAQGQLGDNTTTQRLTPVTTFAGGTNWKQVACGYQFASAIKTDGTLWTWGVNAQGQLGDNTTTQRLTPVTTFAGGTNWKQVFCGFRAMGAVKTDGTLWTWGTGAQGELGNNTAINRSTPVTTFAGGTNWKQGSANEGMQVLTYIDDYQ